MHLDFCSPFEKREDRTWKEELTILLQQGFSRLSINNELFFIEVNTIPGFTDHSLMPMSAKVIGKNFDDLVLDILGETCD